MEEIEVYVAGELFPWSRIKWRRSFAIPGQLLDIDIPSLESFNHMDALEVKLGGAMLTKGNLYKYGWATGKRNATVITGFNYKRKLQQLPGIVTAGGTEAATHLRNQLTDTSITEGTFNNYGNIALDYGATTQALFMRRTPIEDLLFATGWEWNILPGGSSNFKSQCGSDKSSSVKFSREEGTLLGWEEDYVENGIFKVERVRVLGRGMGDAQAGGLASTGGYSAGDPEITINRSSLPTDAMCASAATVILADLQNSIKYGVPRVVYEPTTAFDVFDLVNIVDSELGIDENLRVAQIEMDILPRGITTLLTLCNITHLQTIGEMYISKMRSRIEDDYARTKSIQDLDDIDDGSNYLRTKKDTGRSDYFGTPRFHKFMGEDETGYDITETLSGNINIEKDKLLVAAGANPGYAIVHTPDERVDMTKNPSIAVLFEINSAVDNDFREHYFGVIGSGHNACCFIDGLTLKSQTAGSGGTEEQTMVATLTEDQEYFLEIFCRDGAVYFYLDRVLKITHTTEVPSAGTTYSLYALTSQTSDPTPKGPYNLYIYQFDVSQKW